MNARLHLVCPRPLKALSLTVALATLAPLHSAMAAETVAGAARSYALAPGPLGNVLAQFAMRSAAFDRWR